MMNPAGEKKQNGNNSRPKTVPRLQRVIAAAAPRSVRTVSQSIKTAPQFFSGQQQQPLFTAHTAVFKPPLCADTLCTIRRIITVITDYLTNSHVNNMLTDHIKATSRG